MIKKVNKTEIANIIGMHPKSLRRLSSEQIEKRLLQNCWELIKVEKQGRNLLYTLKYKECNIEPEVFIAQEFHVKDGGRFIQHSKIRITHIENDAPLSRGTLSKLTGNSINTTYNYDNKLENKGVITKNQYYYIKKEGLEEYSISKEEYNNFWRENKALRITFQQLGDKVEAGDINLEEYNYLYEQLRQSSHVYCYKVRKFLVDTNSIYYNILHSH